MDIKISGVSYALMAEALEKARRARMNLLDIMDATISAPRTELRWWHP